MKTALALLLFTSVAFAHHGPNKKLHHADDPRIEVLSKKISKKPSAQLLTLRAKVFIELGNKKEARHDLEHALLIDKGFEQAAKLLKGLD